MRQGIVVAFMLLVFLAPAAQAATKPLEGPGFSTRHPAGWQSKLEKARGFTVFTITTPATTVDEIGLPAAGGIALTVGTMTTKTFREHLKQRVPSSPVALMKALIATPPDATGLATTTPPHRTSLGGTRAGGEAFTYTYKGANILQHDVVTRHGDRVYWVELDADQARTERGGIALRVILNHWQWDD
jgi:hypothetical protein